MGLKNQIHKNYEEDDIITTWRSDVIDLSGLKSFSMQAVINVDVPAADEVEAVDTDEDTATFTAHDLTTGLKGQLTTTDTLPAGLSLLTDYFIIVVDADTVKFATTLANALAGTDVDITDAGTGTHTFTPTAIAGATLTLEKSNDNVHFDAIESATSITVDATKWLEKDEPTYKYFRMSYTLTAGRISVDNWFYGEEVA